MIILLHQAYLKDPATQGQRGQDKLVYAILHGNYEMNV